MKKELKLNTTNLIVFAIWLLILGITGVVYYTSVYGGDNSKVVGVHAASDYIDDANDTDILEDKIIVGFGDSIMRGKGTDDISLTQQIAEKHNMRFQDFSRSGATVASKERTKENLTLNMQEQVKILVEQVGYTDYILFNGGTNDASSKAGMPIGTITEDFDDKRDLSTFCGGFEEIISILKDTYPNAVIVYARAHVMDRRDYKTQLIYGEEAIKMCKKWDIGYADIFEDSDLNTYLDRYLPYTMITKDFPKGDMVHPTYEGYKLFYIPYIEEAFRKAVSK
ncbi:MAG: SGNH/GDSL hydrolase family protein [Lachnospiraceae bacterium]|nr:SGNH/GDSL hydrolase family protein [Lachnospiraceae bacterium]